MRPERYTTEWPGSTEKMDGRSPQTLACIKNRPISAVLDPGRLPSFLGAIVALQASVWGEGPRRHRQADQPARHSNTVLA